MIKFRIESKILEKLKEQDLNINSLLREHFKKYEKPRASKEELKKRHRAGRVSINEMKELTRNTHNKDVKEIAEKALQTLKELQKVIDNALYGYNG